MYSINEKVWAIIDYFDQPKESVIVEIVQSKKVLKYKIKYKSKIFEIDNKDVYPDQIEAEIFWAIQMIDEYDNTLKSDMFSTDDYEIAKLKAQKIIEKYTNTHPETLLKYL